MHLRTKNILALALAMLLIVLSGAVLAEPISGSNLSYTIANGTLTISGSGAMPNYSQSDPAPWKSSYAQFEQVVIGDGVTTIGDYAFLESDNLTSVSISSSVTSIGKAAFMGSALTEVTIPPSVKTIGKSAFHESDLQTVTISNGVETIGIYAFANCRNLKPLTIPPSVKTIVNSAFAGCSVMQCAVVPSGASIGNNAFGSKRVIKAQILPSSACGTIVLDSYQSGNANLLITPAAGYQLISVAFSDNISYTNPSEGMYRYYIWNNSVITVTATFEIVETSALPQTGDNSRAGLWIAMCLMSMAGVLMLMRSSKRETNN